MSCVLQNRYVVDAGGYFHFYGLFYNSSHVCLVVDNPIYTIPCGNTYMFTDVHPCSIGHVSNFYHIHHTLWEQIHVYIV